MIIPDINVLIYAYDTESPFHQSAKRWWEKALSGSEPIGIPWVVVLGFTRLMTHPHICRDPLSIDQIRGTIAVWVERPQVRVINPSENAVETFLDLLEEAGMGGNLCTDALIALHAREHSGTVYSNDRDLDRFRGVKRVNPLH